ncbi:MAG: histidine kinase [Bacteroidetes bacterium]|nr:histidine kinase [Bacteroidota bacterium]
MKYFRNLPIPFTYIFVAFLLLSMIGGLRSYAAAAYWGMEFSQKDLICKMAVPFFNYMPWAFLSPLVYWIQTRFPFNGMGLSRAILFHLTVSVLVAIFHEYFSTFLFNTSALFVTYFEGNEVEYTPWGIALGSLARFMEYWVIAAVFLAVDYYQKYRDHQYQLASMQKKLVTSQLNALRMQLHPHFLFNTLNTISALMEKNVEEGQKVIAHLGDLLRKFLDRDQQDLITLKEEMDYLKSYLTIEKIRFSDRLNIEYIIPPEAESIKVPNLMLQPLVENALKHGLASEKDLINIKITGQILDNHLELCVEDTGIGIEDVDQIKTKWGVGLNNLTSRLEMLYPNNYSFNIESVKNQGTKIKIQIPINYNGHAKDQDSHH